MDAFGILLLRRAQSILREYGWRRNGTPVTPARPFDLLDALCAAVMEEEGGTEEQATLSSYLVPVRWAIRQRLGHDDAIIVWDRNHSIGTEDVLDLLDEAVSICRSGTVLTSV